MLIQKIMDSDIESCYAALEKDLQLKKLEDSFYDLLSKFPGDVHFDMERRVSAYKERVIRIAYLQGIIDFSNLFIDLKEDVQDILKKYADG